jgi:outer membrane scaffolding protein for murein synthesis (MipA/OmpV family)
MSPRLHDPDKRKETGLMPGRIFPPRARVLGFAALLASAACPAGQFPLWEIGAGLAVLNLPDYRGADVTSTYVLPIPYIRYRGEILKADRDGLRGLLFDSEKVEINISLNGTLAADSDDNLARAGMADIETTVEIGPTFDFHLWRSTDRRMQLDFRVPVRASITVESSPEHIGWLLWPNLKLEVQDPLGHAGWDFDIQAGPTFSDGEYHEYFYSVGPADATAVRPAYSAAGGYSGTQISTSLTKRFPRYWVGGFLRYEYLSGAVFEDSPLVTQESALSVGVALSWVLGESSKRVEAEQ